MAKGPGVPTTFRIIAFYDQHYSLYRRNVVIARCSRKFLRFSTPQAIILKIAGECKGNLGMTL
jgi:hypothetical protein